MLIDSKTNTMDQLLREFFMSEQALANSEESLAKTPAFEPDSSS